MPDLPPDEIQEHVGGSAAGFYGIPVDTENVVFVTADFEDTDLAAANGAGRIEMLPSVPDTWFGQPIDVRGMTTGLGTLSFSVRWHGERPAVLWERVGGPDDTELVCPGLDSAWSSRARSGEADRRS